MITASAFQQEKKRNIQQVNFNMLFESLVINQSQLGTLQQPRVAILALPVNTCNTAKEAKDFELL